MTLMSAGYFLALWWLVDWVVALFSVAGFWVCMRWDYDEYPERVHRGTPRERIEALRDGPSSREIFELRDRSSNQPLNH